MVKISDRVILVTAILWYSLTAYFSIGYFHGDEHYQIIEFSGIKEGTHISSDLAWEYQAQIRPSTQPAICFVIFKICSFFSLSDPYVKTFILRLLTGLFAVFSIYYFTNSCRHLVASKYWKAFLILSFFTWFLPFVNVRFSSETWSGLLLLLAVAIIIKKNKNWPHYFSIGLLLGLSFLFRFQTGIVSASILLWLMVIKKESYRNIATLIVAGVLVTLLGTLIDFWFYKSFVITPWNYLKTDIIDGMDNKFGTSPWYFYVYYVFRFSFFPFGILILFSFIFYIYKAPKSLFIWIILPYLIIHSFISHKELRFLFPIINFVPIVFFLSLQEIKYQNQRVFYKKFLSALVFIMVIINLAGLVTSSLKPADIGRMRITKKIHELISDKPMYLLSCCNSNPYDPWGGLVAKFYMEPNLTFSNLSSVSQLEIDNFKQKEVDFLVVKKKYIQNESVKELISKYGFKSELYSIPHYFEPILKIYGGYPMEDILVLYSK